jgi:hypothetical protein
MDGALTRRTTPYFRDTPIRARTGHCFPVFPGSTTMIHENTTTFPPFPLEFTPEKGRRIWQRLGGRTPPQTCFSALRQGNGNRIAGRPLRTHVPVLRRRMLVSGWEGIGGGETSLILPDSSGSVFVVSIRSGPAPSALPCVQRHRPARPTAA